jgi:hypothetical protein
MNDRPRNQSSRRRRSSQPRGPKSRGLWAAVPAPDEPEPIIPATDPSALIDSLGAPPLKGHSSVAEHYLAAVVERAATLATGLADVAGLLSETDDE